MRKASNILLIIAGGCVAVGVLLCFASAAMITYNPNYWSVEDFHTVNHTVTEAYTSIRVEGNTDSNLNILPAKEGQEYQVVSYEREDQPHTVRVENGTLIITQKDERKWYDHIVILSFPFSEPKITVYVPETAYDSLYVEGTVGDVETHDSLSFGDVDIRLSTGDIKLYSNITGALNIKTSTGDMKIRNVNPTSITLTAGTGDIELYKAKIDGEVSITTDTGAQKLLEVSCRNLNMQCSTGGLDCHQTQIEGAFQFQSSTGRVAIGQVTCGSVSGTATSGDIVCEGLTVAGELRMETDTGDVALTRSDAATLHITTDTGDIEGSLLSEKIFFTESDTGHIRVPKGTAGGTCEIRTDTGDITFTVVP